MCPQAHLAEAEAGAEWAARLAEEAVRGAGGAARGPTDTHKVCTDLALCSPLDLTSLFSALSYSETHPLDSGYWPRDKEITIPSILQTGTIDCLVDDAGRSGGPYSGDLQVTLL